jgi:NAD(P)-dependent dehydrogenase (short-subunit alcohol dehydrogenase family)
MVINNELLGGKTVVVTGGTGRIGRAIVEGIIDAGGNAVCGYNDTKKAFSLRQSWSYYGHPRLQLCRLDVCDNTSIVDAVAVGLEVFGQINGLVNCAGGNLKTKKSFLDTTRSDFQRMLDLNLLGSALTSQAVCQQMLLQGRGGVVINICSVASFQALSGVHAYAASKAAVAALTGQMAADQQLTSGGIRTIGVAPGFLPTTQNEELLKSDGRGPRILDRTPLKRYGQPVEVANLVVFFLSDLASFINGSIHVVDGGFMSTGVIDDMGTKQTPALNTEPIGDSAEVDGSHADLAHSGPSFPTTPGKDQEVIQEPVV